MRNTAHRINTKFLRRVVKFVIWLITCLILLVLVSYLYLPTRVCSLVNAVYNQNSIFLHYSKYGDAGAVFIVRGNPPGVLTTDYRAILRRGEVVYHGKPYPILWEASSMATFPMRRQGNVLKIHLFTAIAIAAYVPADVLEGVETK